MGAARSSPEEWSTHDVEVPADGQVVAHGEETTVKLYIVGCGASLRQDANVEVSFDRCAGVTYREESCDDCFISTYNEWVADSGMMLIRYDREVESTAIDMTVTMTVPSTCWDCDYELGNLATGTFALHGTFTLKDLD
jgi:hypothetical protein